MINIKFLPWVGKVVGFGFPNKLSRSFGVRVSPLCWGSLSICWESKSLLTGVLLCRAVPYAKPLLFLLPACRTSLESACLLVIPFPICLWGFIPLCFFNFLEVRSQDGEDINLCSQPFKFNRSPKTSFCREVVECWVSVERTSGNWGQNTFRYEFWRLKLLSLTEKWIPSLIRYKRISIGPQIQARRNQLTPKRKKIKAKNWNGFSDGLS